MIIPIDHIKHFVELHSHIAYILIALGALLEGEIAVILGGIFAHLGSLNVFIVFIATIVGGGSKSLIGYALGAYLQKKHSGKPFLNYAERRVNHFFPKFSERPFGSIFLSRFLILGLHWFSLLLSGYKKVKFRVFAEAELASLLVWSVLVLALGYFFSFAALSVSRDVRKFAIIVLIFFVGFLLLEKAISFFIELIRNSDDKDSLEN